MGNTSHSEQTLREQMCEIGRRIWQKGFCAGNEGNHSCRLSPDRFLCTPTGVSKGFMNAEDLCVVDSDGAQISGTRKRSSEFLMHAAIYKARADVNAVIHSHPPHVTAFAVAGIELPTGVHPEAELVLGPVKMAPYVTPGDQRLADSVLPFVQRANTVMLKSHGVVCFDRDLEQAYYDLEVVEAYARLLLLARSLGNINTLSAENVAELIQTKLRAGVDDPRASGAGRHEQDARS